MCAGMKTIDAIEVDEGGNASLELSTVSRKMPTSFRVCAGSDSTKLGDALRERQLVITSAPDGYRGYRF